MQVDKILAFLGQKKIWLTSLCCLLFVLAVSYSFSYSHKKSLLQLDQIEKEFEAWRTYQKPGQKLDQLGKKILSSPLLRYYYLGNFAKEMLISGDVESAEKYSNQLFGRASIELPFFAQYSSISFLIGKKQLQQALVASYRLKKEMLIDPQFLQGQALSLLFTMNLFRIALLEKTLDHSQSELDALVVLENYLKKNINDPLQEIVSKQIDHLFQSNGRHHLKDYISYRKSKIEKSTL